MSDVRLLDPQTAARERARLVDTLTDCVAGGASVGFMQPFSADEAARWWDGVIDSVAAGGTILFGAYVDGVLSGTVQLGLASMPNQRHRGDVKKLLVHRNARNRGLAGRLMGALEDEASKRGLTLLTLDTATGSEAEPFYEKRGWTRTGVIPNFARWPEGPLCDTTIFWKALA